MTSEFDKKQHLYLREIFLEVYGIADFEVQVSACVQLCAVKYRWLDLILAGVAMSANVAPDVVGSIQLEVRVNVCFASCAA